MKTKGILAISLCLVFLASAFTSFAQANVPVTKVQATDGERLYVAMQQDMPNFNNFDLGSNSIWKANVIGWCFGSLSGLDTDGNVYPSMAESWTFDEPNLKVTVKLRDNMKFHDGTTVTADDVVFSYQILRGGATISSSIVDAFDGDSDGTVTQTEINAGVKKVDAKTIEFKMAKPYGQFFLATLGVTVLPKAIWKDHLTTDGLVDVQWGTDPKAVIGTGPYVYKEGTTGVYRLLERFDGFWGKNFTTPAGAKIWPAGVNEIYFKIYSNIDTAVLALESGDVDYIAWAVTAGKIPEVQANPKTQITFMPDNGYFYLAFNQKKEPVNSLAFRKAVSYCIDKTTAVSSYMGGYGVEGDSCEPPFWTQWYNSSVEHYTFSLNEAKKVLDDANFKDTDSDGWRNMPDGRAIPPITLLTPPADYDPIRIKIGTMVATNMRSIGIDVTAKPVDFDTLVAKMNAFDYTMLELGWSLSSDPIGNVFDILGPMASQNTFGFWSSTHPNPYYQSTGGGGPYGTLADAETQALADKVYDLADKAKGTFDIQEQIKYTKEAQGLISKAIPLNVMYYRVAAEGSSRAWTGWTPFMGSLFNQYTLANLKRTTEAQAVGELSIMFNAPPKVELGGTGKATVYAFDGNGLPVNGVAVTLSSSSSNITFPATGTTNANGTFTFDVTGAMEGISVLNAKVALSGVEATSSATIEVYGVTPKYLFLSATPSKYFISAGGTVDVTLEAKDEKGTAVSGAVITIDPNQLKAGSLDKSTLTTDASGKGTIKYTAPATATPNNHLSPTIAMEIKKAGYTFAATLQLSLVILNTGTSTWKVAEITNVSRIGCDAANPSAKIDIKAGANEKLTLSYTNSSMLTTPPATVTCDATGKASVTLTFKALTETAALRVGFLNLNSPYAISDSVTLVYKGTTPPAGPVYGGTVAFTSRSLDPFDTLDVTVSLWDQDNNVPNTTVKAAMCVAGTPDGVIARSTGTNFDSNWDMAGLLVNSVQDGSGLTSSGPFGADFDEATGKSILIDLLAGWYGVTVDPNATMADVWTEWCNNEYGGAMDMPKSVDIVNGTATFDVTGEAASLRDLPIAVSFVPNGMCIYDGTNWVISGDTTLSSDIVAYRGQDLITASFMVANPLISTAAAPMNTTVEIVAKDQTNTAVADATVSAYSAIRLGSTYTIAKSATGKTDTAGKATVTVEIQNAALTKAGFATGMVKADLFVKASKPGYVTVLQVTQIVIAPALMQLDLSVTPRVELTSSAAKTVTVTGTATLSDGTPIKDANVTLSSSLGTVTPDYALTDASGKVTFTVSLAVAKFAEFPYLFVTLKGKAQADKTQGTGSQVQFEIYATAPTVTVTTPADGATIETEGDTVTVWINGTAADSKTVTEISVKVDNGTWEKQTITAGTNVPFAVSKALTATEAGQTHTVQVKATDSFNLSKTLSITITAKKKAVSEPPVSNMMMIIIVVVVIVAILIVVVLMMMRKGGSKPEATPEPKPEPKAEEKPTETKPEEPKAA